MSLGTHTDTRIDNTHGVLKVCRLVPTAKSSNYKIIIKDHMNNNDKSFPPHQLPFLADKLHKNTYIAHYTLTTLLEYLDLYHGFQPHSKKDNFGVISF